MKNTSNLRITAVRRATLDVDRLVGALLALALAELKDLDAEVVQETKEDRG